MTVNIEKGDRVRATSKSVPGDFSVFQVDVVYSDSRGYASQSNYFGAGEFAFELIQKAPKPVPTQAGIYEFEKNSDAMRNLVLTTDGSWYWLDMTGENVSDIFYPIHDPSLHVQQGIRLVLAEKG